MAGRIPRSHAKPRGTSGRHGNLGKKASRVAEPTSFSGGGGRHRAERWHTRGDSGSLFGWLRGFKAA